MEQEHRLFRLLVLFLILFCVCLYFCLFCLYLFSFLLVLYVRFFDNKYIKLECQWYQDSVCKISLQQTISKIVFFGTRGRLRQNFACNIGSMVLCINIHLDWCNVLPVQSEQNAVGDADCACDTAIWKNGWNICVAFNSDPFAPWRYPQTEST